MPFSNFLLLFDVYGIYYIFEIRFMRRFLFWNDVLNALKKFLAYCEIGNSEGILSKSLMLPLHS